jgi:hypothetical protein
LNDVQLTLGLGVLYEIYDNKNISVARCAELNWQINFKRMLDSETYEDWTNLQNLLNDVQTTTDEDEITWGPSSSKKFTTKKTPFTSS